MSIAAQKFATSSITDLQGSDTTWELKMLLHKLQAKICEQMEDTQNYMTWKQCEMIDLMTKMFLRDIWYVQFHVKMMNDPDGMKNNKTIIIMGFCLSIIVIAP